MGHSLLSLVDITKTRRGTLCSGWGCLLLWKCNFIIKRCNKLSRWVSLRCKYSSFLWDWCSAWIFIRPIVLGFVWFTMAATCYGRQFWSFVFNEFRLRIFLILVFSPPLVDTICFGGKLFYLPSLNWFLVMKHLEVWKLPQGQHVCVGFGTSCVWHLILCTTICVDNVSDTFWIFTWTSTII